MAAPSPARPAPATMTLRGMVWIQQLRDYSFFFCADKGASLRPFTLLSLGFHPILFILCFATPIDSVPLGGPLRLSPHRPSSRPRPTALPGGSLRNTKRQVFLWYSTEGRAAGDQLLCRHAVACCGEEAQGPGGYYSLGGDERLLSESGASPDRTVPG